MKLSFRQLGRRALLCTLPLGILLASSCAPATGGGGDGSNYLTGYQSSQQVSNPYDPNESGYWDGDNVQGSPLIRINLNEQKAYFYKGSQLVSITPISGGREGKDTPRGTYKITQKSPNHRSSIYGNIRSRATGEIIKMGADNRVDRWGAGEYFDNTPMPHFLRFNGPVGMHAGHLPGYPASAGCVRVPPHMAQKFFEHSTIGTPVIVE